MARGTERLEAAAGPLHLLRSAHRLPSVPQGRGSASHPPGPRPSRHPFLSRALSKLSEGKRSRLSWPRVQPDLRGPGDVALPASPPALCPPSPRRHAALPRVSESGKLLASPGTPLPIPFVGSVPPPAVGTAGSVCPISPWTSSPPQGPPRTHSRDGNCWPAPPRALAERHRSLRVPRLPRGRGRRGPGLGKGRWRAKGTARRQPQRSGAESERPGARSPEPAGRGAGRRCRPSVLPSFRPAGSAMWPQRGAFNRGTSLPR